MPKHKTVIFVNGCFWHGHETCRHGRIQAKRNSAFWRAKIAQNRERDARVRYQIRELGWRVLTFWECECKDREMLRQMICTELGAQDD